MPELNLQTIQISHTNGHVTKIDWGGVAYKQMVQLVEELAGPRPEVPQDIVAPEWSSQAIRVLKERYHRPKV